MSTRAPAGPDSVAGQGGLPVGLSADLRARLQSVAVATLSSQLRSLGYSETSIDGVASVAPGQKMVGLARTLRFVPFRKDLFERSGGGYNAQKRAFDTLEAGAVLVIEARGERHAGTIGDILALCAKVRGAAGVVTDGAVRDAREVRELAQHGIPVFGASAHPAVLGRRHVPWEAGVTIACGGAAVQPGDVVVGDDDGVVVIPPLLLEHVLERAEAQECEERYIADRVAEGAGLEGLYPLAGDWRSRYEDHTMTKDSQEARS